MCFYLVVVGSFVILLSIMGSMTQVRVEGKPGFENPAGQHVAHQTGAEPTGVTVVREYYLEGLTPEMVEQVLGLLVDPVTELGDTTNRDDWLLCP